MAKKRATHKKEHVEKGKEHKVMHKTAHKEKLSQSESEAHPSAGQSHEPLLSHSFYSQLNDFSTLYKDFLTLKTSPYEHNVSSALSQVLSRVHSRIESEALGILRGELESVEEWIGGEIVKIEEDIKSIESAYEVNRESLLKTGVFSEEEVKRQLGPVERKIEVRKENKEQYRGLLDKAKSIYV